MAAITRHPGGIPTGGQFAPSHKSESGIALLERPIRYVDDLDGGSGFSSGDGSTPEPQANDLERISAAVEAVYAGANTAAAVADAVDVAGREGGYYANAAATLGLVRTIPANDQTKTYELTELGQRLIASDADGKVDILRDAVAATPGVQVYADGGEDAVVSMLMEDGALNEVTAARRASTIRSWHDAFADGPSLAAAVQQTSEITRGRAAAAAERAAEMRRMKAPTKPKLAVCGICNMAVALSGECGC